MTRDAKIEKQIADALLDVGISLPLLRLRLPFCRAWVWRVTMARPRLGTMIRIHRLYLDMDITPQRLAAMRPEEQMRFYDRHGKRLSLAIALAVCGGYISGRLVAPLLAWVIRRGMPREYQIEAQKQFMALQSLTDFMPITAWDEAANPLKPAAGPVASEKVKLATLRGRS